MADVRQQKKFNALSFDTQIEDNLNFLLKVLRPLIIAKLLFVLALSTDMVRTGILAAAYVVNVIFAPNLMARTKRNISALVIGISLTLFVAINLVSGSRSPAWILFISPLVPSIFLTPGKRMKVILVVSTNLAAALSTYFAGRGVDVLLAQVAALLAFSLLLFRSYQYLEEQKRVIQQERERSDLLLHNILPRSIVERMKQNKPLMAVRFDMASILFADLVGFTDISSRKTPEELILMLNRIFSEFDRLVDEQELEKIKTIGDAYMVAGGVPEMDAKHLCKIADLALGMQQQVHDLTHAFGEPVQLRIGLHAGPLVGGVIGMKKFSYDVWGDTVNVASRLETHGVPGQIQVSQQLYEALHDWYRFEERGLVPLKGRGEVRTYFLHERTGADPCNVE